MQQKAAFAKHDPDSPGDLVCFTAADFVPFSYVISTSSVAAMKWSTKDTLFLVKLHGN